jgi:hypothetical protein
METPPTIVPANSEPPCEYLYGQHVKLEGGEVDTTVRPSRFSGWRAAMAEQGNSSGSVRKIDENTLEDSNVPAESSIAPGSDLRDWLSRTFE